jgi:cytochrome c5
MKLRHISAALCATAMMATLSFDAQAASGKEVYDATCVACHGTGAAGAPKLGDKAAWAPRLATGLAALKGSATKGKGVMPPKGGNAALSDADISAAVDYMTSQSK